MGFLAVWGIGIVTGLVHLWLAPPSSLDLDQVARLLLLHQFVVTFGLAAVVGFYGMVITPEKSAKKLGWPGGPFQEKYGFTHLGLGVLGILAIWYQDHFWVGALVNMYLYGLMGAYTLVKTMVQEKGLKKNFVGRLVMDIAYQGFLTVLAFWGHIW